MLGSTKLTALLGSAPAPDAPTGVLKSYVKALATEAGLALFYVVPGAKEPADCRTTQARNKAVKDAEAAGEPPPHGLHMATTNVTLLARWLDKYRKDRDETTPVNIGMEVGRSRLVVVDVDTVAEREAFQDWMATETGDPLWRYICPTVHSPGVQDKATGEWIHRGGGHYYFTLPEGLVLPSVTGALKVDHAGSSFNIYWRDRYVLVPPSRRPEGDYWLAGTDHPLPDAIAAAITDHALGVARRTAERAERAKARADGGLLDDIEIWGLGVPWEDLLERAEWIPTGRVDRCSCPIWTRPENPANKKSATAHGPECSDPRFDPANPPLHVWSDNVTGGLADWISRNGTKTLSKLQFIAAVFHEGDVSTAMVQNGIRPDDGQGHGVTTSAEELSEDLGAGSSQALADQLMDPAPYRDALYVALESHGAPPEILNVARGEPTPVTYTDTFSTPVLGDPWVIPDGPPMIVGRDLFVTPGHAEAVEDRVVEVTVTTDEPPAEDGPQRPVLAPFDHWRNLPPPEFVVDGWIQDRALSAFIGPPGVGKSAVVLDMACSVSVGIPWQGHKTKRSRVLYIAGEGGAGAAQRVKAWESEHGFNVGQDLWMITEAVLIGSKDRDLWNWLAAQVREHGIHLVIFDTLARMSLGLEENSASDMGNAVARFDRLRREADTGVMVVHHTARAQSHGRGSTAILGALDSEILIDGAMDEDEEVSGPGKSLSATVTKQKNAMDGAKVALTLCERHGSIVVADQHGHTGDPLTATILDMPLSVPESDTDLAIRVAEYVAGLPMQGATKTELVRDVKVGKAYRKSKDTWRAAIVRAVDRGLATGLLVTLGSDRAQRYGRGPSTPEQAKALDRAEAEDAAVSKEGS